VDIWLFLSQGWRTTIPAALLWLDPLHGTFCRRPLTNTAILLLTTEDFPLRQSKCFISTLVTVILLLEWASVTISHTPHIGCSYKD